MPNDVDAWKAKNPMKPVVEAVRQVVLKADKRIAETIKWQSPTFVYKGNLAVARYMRLASLAEVKAKSAELKRIVEAWCNQRDAHKP